MHHHSVATFSKTHDARRRTVRWAVLLCLGLAGLSAAVWARAQAPVPEPGGQSSPPAAAAEQEANAPAQEGAAVPAPEGAPAAENPPAVEGEQPGVESPTTAEPAPAPAGGPETATPPVRPIPRGQAVPKPIIPARQAPTGNVPPVPGGMPGAPQQPGTAKAAPPPPASANGTSTPEEIAYRPNEGEQQQKDFEVNYEDTDLIQIVKSIGAMTGKNFDVDPQIGQMKVTIVAHKKISADMAYEVLESVLASRGYSMIPTLGGNLIKIVPNGEASEKTPLVVGSAEALSGFDTVSTHILPVQYADVTELQSILPTVGSKNAQVRAYAKTNTLIVTDNADGIRNILKLLTQLDIPGFDAKMEIFPLEYTRAETLAQQIMDVLGATTTSATPRPNIPGVPSRPMAAPRPGARPTVPGQPQQMVVGSREETLQIVSDERMNALIVKASDGMMEQVRDLIKKLDKELPYEANNMNIVELQNADAEKMEQALNAVIGTTPRQGQGGAAGGGAQQSPQQSAEIQPFEKKVIITKYERTNALLILASPQDFKVLKELIARLDIPTRQVHVEAIIMDVIIGDKFSLSVESTALSANDAFALNNVVKLANVLSQGPLAAAGNGATVGVLNGTTKVTLPNGSGGVVSATIPNVPLLLSALENLTNVDILSQPSLTTIDNEKAEFVVGQEVPFITGSSRSLDQSTVSSSVFSNVNREDVGIKLNVTPQISQGDNVLLDLSVEVSQTVQSDVGADVNVVGPTVQKSKVANKVTIMDGCTGVIAGLVSESTDRTINQTPVAGDLPVIGFLFRGKSSNRSKRNLAILVTPNIVRQGVDLERMTQYRLDQFDKANIDLLFEKGFIKKTRERYDKRQNYRPSAVKSAEIRENGGRASDFSQGNMRQP